MRNITHANSDYSYSNQQFDEIQALLSELQRDATPYLVHRSGLVRCYADWTLEFYKIRSLRSTVDRDNKLGDKYLGKLYTELRKVA